MVTRRTLLAIALTGAMLASSYIGPPALAQTVDGLAVSNSRDGPDMTVFSESARSLWVRFIYDDAGDTTFEITLTSPAGVAMFSHRAELTGSGSAAWEVTGDAVARGLTAGIGESALTAQDYAQRAASGQRGVAEFLATTAFAISQMESSLRLLDRLPLDYQSRDHRRKTFDAAGEIQHLLTRARALPPGNEGGRQEYARQMAAPAAVAVDEADALEVAMAAVTGLPLPPTRTGTNERDAFTVAVRINGSPAQTRSIWLFDGNIFLPAASRPAMP